MTDKSSFIKKTGLALGSGSARGWAHIGVLQALEEAGIVVDCISGTSIGALVGAIYASGNFSEMENAVLQLNRKKILAFSDILLAKSGLIDSKKMTYLFEPYVLDCPIEELPFELAILATDLTTGGEIIIREGNLVEAIRASFSFPGVFTPVEMNGDLLVDGGLVNPVPVSAVKKMGANFVIAVDLNNEMAFEAEQKLLTKKEASENKESDLSDGRFSALYEKLRALDVPAMAYIKRKFIKNGAPSIFQVLMTSVKIMKRRIAIMNLQVDPPDILIQPNLGHISFMGFDRAEEVITEGYRATKVELDKWNKKQKQS